MSQTITQIIEGWSNPLQYRLESNGSAYDLSGMTVVPHCENKYGTVVSSSSELTTDSSTGGLVSWNPASTDTIKAAHGPYLLQFLVYDGQDDLGIFPSGEPIQLRVRPLGNL